MDQTRILEGMPRELAHETELQIVKELVNLPNPWSVLINILLPARSRNDTPDETDVILIGPPGVYSLEIKYWRGEIYGFWNDAWVYRTERKGFLPESWPNPIKTATNKKNILYSVMKENNFRGIPVYGGVIFPNREICTVNITKPTFTVNMPILQKGELVKFFESEVSNLGNWVNGNKPRRLSEKEITQIFNFIKGKPSGESKSEAPLVAGPYVFEKELPSYKGDYFTSYKAHNQYLPENRALIRKLNIDPILTAAQYKEVQERLLREAQALYLLRGHPNVLDIFGPFTHAGDTYVAYEWVDGTSLEDIIDQRDYNPINIFKNIMFPVMNAIRSAHAKGIIHRSLTPRSITVTPDWQVKVVDFAIARALEPSQKIQVTRLDESPYTAYEAGSGNYNHLIDIYSVGAICYEIVMGTAPIPPSKRAVGNKLKFEGSPVGRVPPSLQDVIYKAMSIAAGNRYQTMDEMIKALQEALLDIKS